MKLFIYKDLDREPARQTDWTGSLPVRRTNRGAPSLAGSAKRCRLGGDQTHGDAS